MSIQINSVAASGGTTAVSAFQERKEFIGALAAALNSGDLMAAQQALLGLRGVGSVSPSTVFNKIDQAVKLHDVDRAKDNFKEWMDVRNRDRVRSAEDKHAVNSAESHHKVVDLNMVDPIERLQRLATGTVGRLIRTMA